MSVKTDHTFLIQDIDKPENYSNARFDYSKGQSQPRASTFPDVFREISEIILKNVFASQPVFNRYVGLCECEGVSFPHLFDPVQPGEHLVHPVASTPEKIRWDYKGWTQLQHMITYRTDELHRLQTNEQKERYLEMKTAQLSRGVSTFRDSCILLLLTKWAFTAPTEENYARDKVKDIFKDIKTKVDQSTINKVLNKCLAHFMYDDTDNVKTIPGTSKILHTVERLLGYFDDNGKLNAEPFKEVAGKTRGKKFDVSPLIATLLVMNQCIYSNKIDANYKWNDAMPAQHPYLIDEYTAKLSGLYMALMASLEECMTGSVAACKKYNIKRGDGGGKGYASNNKKITPLLCEYLKTTDHIAGLNLIDQVRTYEDLGSESFKADNTDPGLFVHKPNASDLFILMNPTTYADMLTRLPNTNYPGMFNGSFKGVKVITLPNIEKDGILVIHRDTLNRHVFDQGRDSETIPGARIKNEYLHWSECWGMLPYTCFYLKAKKTQ